MNLLERVAIEEGHDLQLQSKIDFLNESLVFGEERVDHEHGREAVDRYIEY